MPKRITDPGASTTTKKARPTPTFNKRGQETHFSTNDYSAVDKQDFSAYSSINDELQYLKRIKMRAELANLPDTNPWKDQITPVSALEAETGRQLKKLSDLASSTDEKDRLIIETIFARFNSRNLFSVASELSKLRLQQVSVQEMSALVEGGPRSFANALVKSTTDMAAETNRMRSGDGSRSTGGQIGLRQGQA